MTQLKSVTNYRAEQGKVNRRTSCQTDIRTDDKPLRQKGKGKKREATIKLIFTGPGKSTSGAVGIGMLGTTRWPETLQRTKERGSFCLCLVCIFLLLIVTFGKGVGYWSQQIPYEWRTMIINWNLAAMSKYNIAATAELWNHISTG